MSETILNGLRILVKLLNITGASVMIIGFIIASIRFIIQIYKQSAEMALSKYRQSIGQAVLFGLEILVAATIINTIVAEDSMDSLILLSIMIFIRTILGWTTFVEINGYWPWRSN